MENNKVALITGASRGIGAATAIQLANEGYDVCINYKNNDDMAQNVVDEIIKNGGSAKLFKADISKPEEVSTLFQFIDNEFGRLDALVNNAGITLPRKSIIETENTEIEKIFSINTFGAFYCCKEAVQRMIKVNGGAIVNITSVVIKSGGNKLAYYTASKGAIDAYTRALANEMAQHNIRVNSVCPAATETDMIVDKSQKSKSIGLFDRMAQPQEIAAAVSFLISDKASYITGTSIDVTCGR